MAEETKTYVFGNGDGSYGTVPAWLAAGNNGILGGNSGLGGGILGFLLGLFFGNGWGGFGGFGNGFGGGAGAGFISNQIDNNAGRELLMNAINSNGEASRSAVSNLASMLGQDFNLVNSGVSALRDGLSALTASTGMSALQIINAIQSGNSSLAASLCDCCCKTNQNIVSNGFENRIATIEQTNALGSAISGSGQRTVDAIADLKTTVIKEFCDAKERDMAEKIETQGNIISQLRGQIDNANQTAQFAAMLAPINSKLVEIEGRQPNTVPVVWPNLTAVNTTPYYGSGFNGYGYGWNGQSYWG